ncbi:hypothetical protein [Nocardioides limicola]|uniref:hypothetical protein n=1 Tax=Nocardioides limicola TaxID=2803368 RepID=UPI00193C2D43|nr:hypothetical protein [Nocardioides sp. DJM-14]
MGTDDRFATPWLRTQLLEGLRLLADQDRLLAVVGRPGSRSEDLDQVLDLLDDTGAVDEPENHVGAFLLGDEVNPAWSLGRALDNALGTSDRDSWARVSMAAEHLLEQMLLDPDRGSE